MLKSQLGVLKTLNGNINNYIPLLQINSKKLMRIVSILNREKKFFKELNNNRILYFSDRFKIDSKTVSHYFAKHTFMFEISLTSYFSNIKIFKMYNIQPLHLLRDLYVFNYKSQAIINRLDRAKTANKEKIMPWMVRCTEEALLTSFKITADKNAILSSNESVVSYLADRLEYDESIIERYVMKYPDVQRVRITKVKAILDYLLNDAKFTTQHIIRFPKILCHSLDTTKTRLEELKKYGCTPSSLVIPCRSRKEYQKFLNKWIGKRKNIHVPNEIVDSISTDSD